MKVIYVGKAGTYPPFPALGCSPPSLHASFGGRDVLEHSRVFLPETLPPGPGSGVTSCSLSHNLHLPVAALPGALLKHLWGDSSAEQEVPHCQFITLFTVCILLPPKKVKCFATFPRDDFIKLKCLYRSAIRSTGIPLIPFQEVFSLLDPHSLQHIFANKFSTIFFHGRANTGYKTKFFAFSFKPRTLPDLLT